MHSESISKPDLAEIAARYEGLLNAAVEAIIVIDARGSIESFNAAAERIFGYAAAEVIGQNINVLMPPTDASRHDRYIEDFHQTRQPRIIGKGREVEGRHKSGRVFPMDLSVGEVTTPAGRKFVGIGRDITRRKAAEDALLKREAENRRIIEHAPVGIFTADPNGALDSLNPALARFLGPPSEALLGRPIAVLFDPPSREKVLVALTEVLNGQGQVQLEGLLLRRAEGTPAEVMLFLDRLTEEGAESRLIGQIIDRSREFEAHAEAQKMREELAHAARLSVLGEMASAIAHEINQPLTAIATQAQAQRRLLLAEAVSSVEVAAGLDLIAEQALHIGQIVKRIRAFITKRESQLEVLDLREMLEQILPLAELDAHRRGVAFRLELAVKTVRVCADAVQLQQVILNLLRNAIDATSAGESNPKEVTIRTHEEQDRACLIVADRGYGVPPEHHAKLFMPFFTTKPEGVGLGLSLSHSIMEAHGGTLSYREREGGGAIFEVCMPVLHAPASVAEDRQ